MKRRVAISLVSHTNVGKTTLARTLLREDVGTVDDRAHVTDLSEAWTLVEADEWEVLLWDTPGFGNSVRLLKRMRREGGAVGWFLHEVWDRVTDRALYCSQQAVRNIGEEADAVLYVVDATQSPFEAGFVAVEVQIIERVGRPLLLVLNQSDDVDEAQLDAWRAFAAENPGVHGPVDLDAHRRCHFQEAVLLHRLPPLLQGQKRADMTAAARKFAGEKRAAFLRSMSLLEDWHQAAADDVETQGRDEKQEAALERLHARLKDRTRELMAELLLQHDLDGRRVGEVEATLDVVGGRSDAPPFTTPGIWGAIVSGAISGLAADAVAGGLTFGGGALVGAILGGLGAGGTAKLVNLARSGDATEMRWSPDFLEQLEVEAALRYLAVAHHGRGGGDFEGGGASSWRARLERADTASASLRETVVGVLREAYPEAVQLVLDAPEEPTP